MIRPPYLARVAAGAAVYAVEESRKLPAAAVMLPMTALSQLLQTTMHIQQFITSLAIRGDQLFSQWGGDPPEVPEWATFDEDEPAPLAGERTRDPCRAVRAVLDAAARGRRTQRRRARPTDRTGPAPPRRSANPRSRNTWITTR